MIPALTLALLVGFAPVQCVAPTATVQPGRTMLHPSGRCGLDDVVVRSAQTFVRVPAVGTSASRGSLTVTRLSDDLARVDAGAGTFTDATATVAAVDCPGACHDVRATDRVLSTRPPFTLAVVIGLALVAGAVALLVRFLRSREPL